MPFSLLSYLKEKNIYLWFIIIVLNIYILSPLLNSGYISDDSNESYTLGTLKELKETPLQYYYDRIISFMAIGCFRPLNFYWVFVFILTNSLKIYKFLALIMVIANLFLLGYFIKLFSKSRILPMLTVGFMPILFQFRLYHDPILCFHWQQQTIFSLTVTSLILLLKYLNSKTKYFLYLSLFLYFCALLIHEIVYVFFILHMITIFFHSSQQNSSEGTSPSASQFSGNQFRIRIGLWQRRFLNIIKTSSPFFISSLTMAFITLFIKLTFKLPIFLNESTSTNTYMDHFASIYVPNLNFFRFLITYIKQIFAAFPLSYLMANPQNLSLKGSFLEMLISPNFVLASGCYFFLFKKLNVEANTHGHKFALKPLLLLGIAFLLLPGILVSLSTKYQYEIIWGLGYIPVYISYFGSSILMSSCIYFIYWKIKERRVKKINVPIISLVLALLASYASALNYNTNKIVVQNFNFFWLYPRSIIEESLKHELFKVIPPSSSLFIDSNYPWDNSAFYLMYSRIKFDYVGIKGSYLTHAKAKDVFGKVSFKKDFSYEFSKKTNWYYSRYDSNSREAGYVILGNIKHLNISDSTINKAISELAYVFVRAPKESSTNISINGHWTDKNNLQSSEPFNDKNLNIDLASYGSNWKIYIIFKEGKLLDLKSININCSSKKS